jgi:uncharacterized protein DUF3892
MAQRVCISCTTKIPRDDPRKRIYKVGGTNADGSRWKLRADQVISQIEEGSRGFYVTVGWRNVDVVVATHSGHKYLKTETDGEGPDNLLALPECR